MDRKEPEEGSSSPNVNLHIADLRRRGTREETVAVTLSEGSSFFIPIEWSREFSKGTPLNEEELEKIQKADEHIRCREWGASFLASREESSGRLVQKMMQRGFTKETSLRVLEELQSLGFQNDHRFAEQWIRSRCRRHPESRSHMEAGLIQRGVEKDMARQVLLEEVSDQDEQEMLIRYIEKVIPPGKDPDEKLIRRIMRRGFSYKCTKDYLFRRNGE